MIVFMYPCEKLVVLTVNWQISGKVYSIQNYKVTPILKFIVNFRKSVVYMSLSYETEKDYFCLRSVEFYFYFLELFDRLSWPTLPSILFVTWEKEF